ncbi:MAG: hypothetical protein ACRESC_07365, partial [Gammaproteobacteria bacterium]
MIVRVWALDKVTDANGNYYTITYQNNGATTGEYWPTEIQYSGNAGAGASPLHAITFDWLPLTAAYAQGSYLAGTLVSHTQRLLHINILYNTSATFTYTLDYTAVESNERWHLESVTECAADGDCLPATNIFWQSSGGAGWDTAVDTNIPIPDNAHAQA